MKNGKMKCWGFKEQTEFVGLMPKTMDILGEDYCEGASDVVVSTFDHKLASDSLNQAADAMEVVCPSDIMAE